MAEKIKGEEFIDEKEVEIHGNKVLVKLFRLLYKDGGDRFRCRAIIVEPADLQNRIYKKSKQRWQNQIENANRHLKKLDEDHKIIYGEEN